MTASYGDSSMNTKNMPMSNGALAFVVFAIGSIALAIGMVLGYQTKYKGDGHYVKDVDEML